MHERGLLVEAEDYPEPDQVDPKFSCRWSKQRDDDEGQFEEIEEEGEHKHKGVDENEKADLAAGQGGQQVFDPDVAVHAIKGQRENSRADQNEHHEGG